MQRCTPADSRKPVSYNHVEGLEVSHGDAYVFVGCGVQHAVCNPQFEWHGRAFDVWSKTRTAWKKDPKNTGNYAETFGAYRYSFVFQFSLPQEKAVQLAVEAGVNKTDAQRKMKEAIGQQYDEEWHGKSYAQKTIAYGQCKVTVGKWDVQQQKFAVTLEQVDADTASWSGFVSFEEIEKNAV